VATDLRLLEKDLNVLEVFEGVDEKELDEEDEGVEEVTVASKALVTFQGSRYNSHRLTATANGESPYCECSEAWVNANCR